MKKIGLLLLSLSLIISSVLPAFAVQAAESPSFQISSKTSGDTATVTISLNQKVEEVAGMQLSLSYDTTALEYVQGSRNVLLKSITSSDINKDVVASGEIVFLADKSELFEVEGNIVSYQFKILSGTNKEITLTVGDFYTHDGHKFVDIPLSSTTASTNITATSDTAVQNVINKIAAIGTVDLSKESVIVDARGSYSALSTMQKNQVTNFQTLVAAERRLSELKNEQKAQEYRALAAAYRERNSEILGKTVETVAITDKALLEAALSDYADENVNVRIELVEDKNLLNRLNTRIQELEAIEAGKIQEAQLKAEAKQMAEEFRKTYADFIALPKDKVVADHLTGLKQAVGFADNQALLNSYFLSELGDDYTKLKDKLAIAEGYVEGTTSLEVLQAQKFQSAYGYLLEMKPEDVSSYDEVDIRTALAFYEMLAVESQELIGSDAKAKLEALLAAVEALPSEDDDSYGEVPTEAETIYVTEDSQSVETAKKSLINLVSRKMSPIIWWMILLTGTMAVLTAAAGTLQIILIRKKNRMGGVAA